MSWAKIITIVVAIALVIGGAVWAYQVFEASESIDVITENWSVSGHADRASESFIHWDEDEPVVIPKNCAKCHSLYGYLDYLGVDGSAMRIVDSPAKTGTVLYCNTCHNETGHNLDVVFFPDVAEIDGIGRWANCMRCHQGRTSTATVREVTEGLADDEVSEELTFVNVHYAIAAATRHGSEVSGGYEYAGRSYEGWYPHTEDYDACTECHDAHSTQINPAICQPCHSNVVNYQLRRHVRHPCK
ncbi:MAG: cytochrome c3 family protein [Anaerolineae bacterium]|nr:cytochrome c3 family protein [Anaerolineae bacterium]